MSVSYVVVATRVPGLMAAADVAGRGGCVTVHAFGAGVRLSQVLHRDDHPEGRALVVFETERPGDRERHAQFALELGCWLDGAGTRWAWAFESEAWSSQPPGIAKS